MVLPSATALSLRAAITWGVFTEAGHADSQSSHWVQKYRPWSTAASRPSVAASIPIPRPPRLG